MLKDYFSFSRSERNGTIILLSIIFILIIVYNFLYLVENDELSDFSGFEKEIGAFERGLMASKKYSGGDGQTDHDTLQLFSFDPNNTTTEEWVLLGLRTRQISTINNYIAKGGKFYKKEDLKKIYGLSEKEYFRLEPYIRIKDNRKEGAKVKAKVKAKAEAEAKAKFRGKRDYEKIVIEINSADTLQLKSLRGIGPVYAGRIIKYRNLLGGFYKKEQLMEVYGINEELYNHIKEYISLDTTLVTKLNINIASFSDLLRHPYLDMEDVKAIINARDSAGGVLNVENLVERRLISEKKYQKIKYYLKYEY